MYFSVSPLPVWASGFRFLLSVKVGCMKGWRRTPSCVLGANLDSAAALPFFTNSPSCAADREPPPTNQQWAAAVKKLLELCVFATQSGLLHSVPLHCCVPGTFFCKGTKKNSFKHQWREEEEDEADVTHHVGAH